jgi:hypothetical protein
MINLLAGLILLSLLFLLWAVLKVGSDADDYWEDNNDVH